MRVYVLLRDADIRPITEHLRGEFGARLVTVFAEDRRSAEGVFFNYYVFEQKGSAQYLIVQAPVRSDSLEFPSLSAELPAVNWQEREIQDWFGLKAIGHPNPRRVALHDNWPDVFPLRKDFPLETVLPPFEGERHIYRPAFGEGVLQVPVGPVHAGIIEPGHFNFAVAGEPILYLQLRMFYTHKGTEKFFEKLPIHKAVFLAESISGDSSFSHGTAFCQAIEGAASIEVPLRGLVMRTILLELERICNHVADIGAIATDVGFVIANAHASRLKETMVTLNEQLTGSRLLRGMVCVGGVRRGWDQAQLNTLRDTLDSFAREFRDLISLIDSSESTRDRLEQTGVCAARQGTGSGHRRRWRTRLRSRSGRAARSPLRRIFAPLIPRAGLPGRRRLAPDAGPHRRSERIDWHHSKRYGGWSSAGVPCASALYPVRPLCSERSRRLARGNHPLDSDRA